MTNFTIIGYLPSVTNNTVAHHLLRGYRRPPYSELSGLRQVEGLPQGQIGVKIVHILAVLQKYWNLSFRVRLHIRLVILVIQTSRFSQEQTIEMSLTLAAGWTKIRGLIESYLEMTIRPFSGHQR